MNLLFHTFGKIESTRGGTERATITVASGLKQMYGCNCYSIYEMQEDTPRVECFVDEVYWSIVRDEDANVDFLRSVLLRFHIDVVIIQGAFIHVKRFRRAVEGLDCKIIFAHHFEPGGEKVFFKFKDVFFAQTNSFREVVRKLYQTAFYPFLRKQYLTRLACSYREAYENAESIILLSEKYIKPYQAFGGFSDDAKFTIIPNALSFVEILPKSELKNKEKTVLIVSRLDERFKKISLALQIWKRVKMSPISKDWKLEIIGHGKDEPLYKDLVAKNKISDVYFLGRQNPISYYKKASIFLMTSRSESWGLTLTEAQQMGCVPMAFDTYPTLRDIITDGEDGFVIEKDNVDAYVQKLLELISDENMRNQMALQGLHSCQRFSQETIVKEWWNLLNEK